MSVSWNLRVGFATVALLVLPGLARAQDVQLVAGSTVPLVQLSGEHFQIQSDGTYFTAPTAGATLSRFGVLGTDLGHPLKLDDKIVLFFGDTVSAYRNGDRYYSSRSPSGVGDSIGYLPLADLSQCRYIGNVATQLASGVRSPAVDPGACPVLHFFTNPSRAADGHVFAPFVISGLGADEGQGTFRVPSSALLYNDRAYVFATTKIQDVRPTNAFWLQSVLAKSEQSPRLWNDTTPPTFARLYTASSHASVEDPANPPTPAGAGGKFMYVSSALMDVSAIADLRLTATLPRELQSADVVFLWGGSWEVHRSNLYVAAVAARDLEAGTARWHYYAGNGRWSASESEAAGVVATDDVSHPSVMWNAGLERFVLTRGDRGRVLAQFAAAPWGPWSEPVTLFSSSDSWFAKLLHRPGADQIVQSLVPIYARDGSVVPMPDGDTGTPYGIQVIESTANADGAVTLFYTMSTWNPYQVFLMRSTFRRTPARP